MNLTALLILAVWLLTAGDHYTTWLALHAPVPGWEVTEANPIARWLFGTFGLVGGLAVDSVLTFVAGIWGYRARVAEETKIVVCLVICLTTGYAIWNNAQALYSTGIW
jgi:hypothetical protein